MVGYTAPEYRKKVWLDGSTPKAEVWCGDRQIDWQWWILFNTSLKNRERKMRKAHKWADDLIELCLQQEKFNL